jgi:hypothetical protein
MCLKIGSTQRGRRFLAAPMPIVVFLPHFLFAPPAPAAEGALEVLHVSSCEQNEVQEILHQAGSAELFTNTQVGLSAFNAGSPDDLSAFDAIVFGVNDCYGDPSRASELREFVEQGGGIVWTHDSLDYGSPLGADVEVPAGVAFITPWTDVYGSQVEVVRDHAMLHEPFEIGDLGTTFPVVETHTSGGSVTNAEIILQFVEPPAGAGNFYLTAHEHEAGRVAVLEIGHPGTLGCSCDRYPTTLTPQEAEILTNALVWVGSGAADCNGNGVYDSKDIRDGTSQDCNRNRIPDECDLSQGTATDCNGNGILDECDLGLDLGFTLEKDIPFPDNPVAVAAGDFSSDGKPDLAVASGDANCINALLQLENGEFFKEPPLDLGNAPTSLVTADLNGDGRLDLVASTKGTQDNLRIFLGSGNCTFPWASMYTVVSGARCIAPADLDGDGDTDLAVGSEKELRIAVLLNAGDGTFSQSAVEMDMDEASSWIAAADFTGDGKIDLAVLRGTASFLTVLKNAGGGVFEPGVPVQAGSSTSLPRCMAAGDWDGDGDEDLAVALEGTSGMALLANAGDGTFAAAKNLPLGAAPIFVASRDLDFDGRPDLATASSAASSATVLRNTGALTFKEMGPFTAGKGASFLALADLVGSVAPDVLVVNSGADSLSVVRNTSSPPIDKDCDSNGMLDSCDIASGAAKDCNANGIPDSCDIASGVLVDADKDGIPDSCQGGENRYLRADANSDGKGDISDAIFTLVHLFRGGEGPACLDAADVTDDGKVDITDPIFLLAYLFAGGLRPADPFGACGRDPTEDGLDCAEFLKCP